MAKFPLEPNRCKKWVPITGKEDLAYVPIKKLNQLKHICGNHFRPKDFTNKKTKLKINAIPSLFIPEKPLSDEIMIEFPLHIAETTLAPTIEHDYCRPYVETAEPSTSTVGGGITNKVFPKKTILIEGPPNLFKLKNGGRSEKNPNVPETKTT